MALERITLFPFPIVRERMYQTYAIRDIVTTKNHTPYGLKNFICHIAFDQVKASGIPKEANKVAKEYFSSGRSGRITKAINANLRVVIISARPIIFLNHSM